ncbi:uncharacterized protein N7477_006000 [Penicillium maclennaniae]|uniref:uncharacterized protein n=1 Tax=Penicillium maclennaniae TaxID=1343394 RepID=UPI0025408976|nr:uncharacterized protein N7477_006000 [Penicillium maclennaniae]KAJ5670637.1 hypothetical protein N7477_006000 [Penicillium maclennaniae]
MAKAKAPKDGKNSKSHIKARLEFLQRAAEFLQSVSISPDQAGVATTSNAAIDDHSVHEPLTSQGASDIYFQGQRTFKNTLSNLSRVSISHMRGVSLKTQTRLPVPVKRSHCKRCDTLLLPGVNCTHVVTNASRGRKKPWADVLVVHCLVCSTEKRFPQTDRKSMKLKQRKTKASASALATGSGPGSG